jgi:hypothetical protein
MVPTRQGRAGWIVCIVVLNEVHTNRALLLLLLLFLLLIFFFVFLLLIFHLVYLFVFISRTAKASTAAVIAS